MNVSGISDLEISVGQWESELDEHLVLEARIYSDGGVIEVEVEAEPSNPTFHIRLHGYQTCLIGRIAHWAGRPFSSSRDPFRYGRLRHFEERYPAIAREYPDIALALNDVGVFRAVHKAQAGTAVIVFVHGTFSCAVPNLAFLHPLQIPTYRFEHDTFLTITKNAENLKEAIENFVPKGARVYLVAHSRGGLVSRVAAQILKSYETEVLTFGTPHRGTPLANIARRAATGILAMGRAVILASGGAAVRAVFPWDPASLAGKLLLKGMLVRKFPDGIDAMRPESDFIGALDARVPFVLRTWGGQCDSNDLHKGAFAIDVREALKGAFEGAANDGIVSFDSATAAGAAECALIPCTHFEYFSRPEVRAKILDLR
jgi:hypothetical protein